MTTVLGTLSPRSSVAYTLVVTSRSTTAGNARAAAADSLGVRIALMVLPVTLLLGAVEVVFRVLPQPSPDAVLDRFVIPDPDLLWRLRPATGGPLATNELGLRDTPYRARTDLEVLVLGDSVAWGDGIDEITRTFSYLLERRLSARYPEKTFEVVNAGVPGYTTEQEATYLELHGLVLEPDAIVVQFTLNDVITRPPWLARWAGREILRAAYGFLLRYSHAFAAAARAMQQRARAQETSQVRELVQPRWSRGVERAWQRVIDQLDRIRSLAAERGIPVLLLATPYRTQLDDPGGRRYPQDRLSEYSAAHGLRYVDVLPELVALPRAATNRCFHDEGHFSHLGHDLVADMLLDPIAETLGLDARRAGSDADAGERRRNKSQAYALADAARAASEARALPKAR
ncbi:MAG: SGNH/GDSL hydrolase family protein, partial [Candidatus Rokuibacteriota bacterium]